MGILNNKFIADVFIWDRNTPCPILYPEIKQAMSGYTRRIIQCKPEYNPFRSGYAHLNYISFATFIFQQTSVK